MKIRKSKRDKNNKRDRKPSRVINAKKTNFGSLQRSRDARNDFRARMEADKRRNEYDGCGEN